MPSADDASGSLSDIRLSDLLERLQCDHRSGELQIITPKGTGTIWIRSGIVTETVFQGSRGEGALRSLLEVSEGVYEIEFDEMLGSRPPRSASPPDREGPARVNGTAREAPARPSSNAPPRQNPGTVPLFSRVEAHRTLMIGSPRDSSPVAARPFQHARTVRFGSPPPRPAVSDRTTDAVELGETLPPSRSSGARLRKARAKRIVGEFELLAPVAKRPLWTVYLCRAANRAGTHRLFAMRLLHSELSQRANIVQAFLADATKLAELQHPNVASVVESGVHAERPYCVMECVEGASFHELLRRYPTERAPQWISRVLLDALQGLSAIHQLRGEDGSPFRLAFFDVAPHNVLVGVDGIARWADFGIERAAAGAAVADVGGVGVRNAAYLSPEQVLDEETDHRTDLFSMGVMAWTALTGERLFDAPTVNQTLENVLHLSVPRPSTIGLQPPRSFDAPCLRALKRQRRARHRSATQLHDDLARAASAHGVAPREELASLIGKTFSQDFVAHRLAVFEASQYGLDITSGDPLYEERRQDAPAALATSVPPFRMTARRRRGRGLKVALGVLSFLVLATAAIGYWAARSETPAPKESPAPSLPATVPIVWPPASAG